MARRKSYRGTPTQHAEVSRADLNLFRANASGVRAALKPGMKDCQGALTRLLNAQGAYRAYLVNRKWSTMGGARREGRGMAGAYASLRKLEITFARACLRK